MNGKKVEGMFIGKADLAANWRMHFTALVNGNGYQHPHADAGFPDSYKGLKVFPFVTLHGFGLDFFSMWLLPEPFRNTNKYEFLHTFKASQMLLMRGDFVHAGVPSTVPRGIWRFIHSQKQAGSESPHSGTVKIGKRSRSCGRARIHLLVILA